MDCLGYGWKSIRKVILSKSCLSIHFDNLPTFLPQTQIHSYEKQDDMYRIGSIYILGGTRRRCYRYFVLKIEFGVFSRAEKIPCFIPSQWDGSFLLLHRTETGTSSLDIYPNFIDACVTALWQWAIENTSLYSVAKYPWIATWARINTQQVRYRPGSGNVHSYSYPVNLNYVCALEFTFH